MSGYFFWKAPASGLPEYTSGGFGVTIIPGFGQWVLLHGIRKIPEDAISVETVVEYLEHHQSAPAAARQEIADAHVELDRLGIPRDDIVNTLNLAERISLGAAELRAWREGTPLAPADAAAMREERDYARAQLNSLVEALKKIQRTPAMPFPDPGAHSWEAFARRVHSAWCDIQRTVNAALTAASRSL